MAVKGKSITVLGAGIGGLTAAIALARRGGRVTVLEQAPEITEVGAGLQITPNATAVFDKLDLGWRALKIGIELEAVDLRDAETARSVLRLDMKDAVHGNPNPYLLMHRADLIDMLAASAKRHGVSILLDKQVTGVAIGFDQATLPIEGGPQRTTKILVGADGVRSLTRQALNTKGQPKFTGQIAWRATVESRYVPVSDMPPVATVYMGPKRHLVTYPLREGRLINIVAVEERTQWAEEGWNLEDDPENLRQAFSGFAPEVRRLLSLCENVRLWGLFAHPVAETWSQGNTIIIGDALHPTLPFLAQGANMAIEDAWVLAEEMDRHDDIQDAFTAFGKRRIKRVKRIVAAATANTNIYHMSNPTMRAAAHLGMSLANRMMPKMMLSRYDWLYGHDVTKGD